MSDWNTLADVVRQATDMSVVTELAEQRAQLKRIYQPAMLEAARKRLAESMREQVFGAAQQLKALDAFKEQAPQVVYVAASAMARKLEAAGITREAFPEFRDKEYVEEAWTQLRAAGQDARSRLSAEERQAGERQIRAIVERPQLDFAIAHQSLVETWRGSENYWARLEADRKRSTGRGVGIGVGVVAGSCIVGLGGYLGAILLMDSSPELASTCLCGAPVLGMIGFIVGIILAIVLGVRGKSDRWKRLQIERAAQQRQLTAQQEAFQQAVETLGQHTSAEYEAVRAERNALIDDLLAQAEPFVLPPELQSLAGQGA